MLQAEEIYNNKDTSDKLPILTNQHMWLYLTVSNDYLRYDELERFFEKYQDNRISSISKLCESSGISRNGTADDNLLKSLVFNYKDVSNDQLFEKILGDLYRLCGVDELRRSIKYNKDTNSIDEVFNATSTGRQYVDAIKKLYEKFFSKEDLIGELESF